MKKYSFNGAAFFGKALLFTFVYLQFAGFVLAEDRYDIQGVGVNLTGIQYPWAPYPDAQVLTDLRREGVEFIRLPVAWERYQSKLGAPLNKLETSKLLALLDTAHAAGLKVIIDIHNSARFDPNWMREDVPRENPHFYVLGTSELPPRKFAEFWKMFAQELKDSEAIIGYGLMNEPHTLPTPTTWAKAAQMAIDAIRAVDKETPVYVSGYGWGYDWVKNNGSEPFVKDPSGRVVYELHIYFDNGGGQYKNTYDQAKATPAKGAELASMFTDWLKTKDVKGFIGEFAIPDNDRRWLPVMDNFLRHLQENGVPATYWSATYRGARWFYPPEDVEKDRIRRGKKNYRNRQDRNAFNISLTPFLDEDGVERKKIQWSVLYNYMPGAIRQNQSNTGN